MIVQLDYIWSKNLKVRWIYAGILYFRTFIYEHRNPTVQIYTKYHIIIVYLIDNLYPDNPNDPVSK